MKRFIVSLFLSTLFIFVLGCFENENGQEVNLSEGIVMEKKDNGIQIVTESKCIGAELEIIGEVSLDGIEVSEEYMVIKTHDNKSMKLALAFVGGKSANISFLIKDTAKKLDINLLKVISTKDLGKIETVKKSSEPVLLGDYNYDNEVNISDFNLFKSHYGETSDEYDIGPAEMGIGETWESVYCYLIGDGRLGLEDLAVFANNFGKQIYGVSNVEVIPQDMILKQGESYQFEAEVTYYGITLFETEVDTWSVENTNIAQIDQNGLLTAKAAGTTKVIATRKGVSGEAILEVFGENAIKVNIKEYNTIWAWDANGEEGNYFSDKWPGKTINDSDGDGWNDYTFSGVSEINLIFSTDGQDKTSDLTRDRVGEYWYYQNRWYEANPLRPYPKVSLDVPGGYFSDKQMIKLGVEYPSGTTGIESRYSLDSDIPEVNGEKYTDGMSIEIGAGMLDGESKTITLWAKATENASGEELEVKESYTFIKGEAKISGLGANYSKTATDFSIWSPDTSDVKLKVDGKEYTCIKVDDFDGYTDVYGVTVQGDLNLKEYQFLINGTPVRDPYGVMVKADTNTNIVVDLSLTDPDGGWASRPTLIKREDAIIYEVHIRDFTIDSTSGISPSLQGKYLGMVEQGTTYNGVKTGIDHLKELGVTHVQIMPFYDFGSKHYNWGYDPVNYNVPEDQYSENPNDYVGRIKEVKNMINEFHKNGIRVIMDVVYNHTFNDSMFDPISPSYYMHYRNSHELTGQIANASGCGNGVDTQVPMVSRFIQDSLEYWIAEYNIDGFRFDLMGIFDVESVDNWGRYLNAKYSDRNLLMYGEPWDGYWEGGTYNDDFPYSEAVKQEIWDRAAERVRMGRMGPIADSRMGVFNGKYREDIKGNNDGKVKGYMFNADVSAYDIEKGMRGGIGESGGDAWSRTFAGDPEQSINYISAHDNYCLWDKILHCDVTGAYAERVNKFGMAMVMTSQGIPFMHGGDEMLRTKVYNGDWSKAHNSYNASDNYNSYKWDWKIANSEIFDYYKELIELRKNHPGLRYGTSSEINSYTKTYVSGKIVVMETDDDKDGEKDLVVVFNPSDNSEVSLPSGNWTKIFDITGKVNESNTIVEGTAVTVFEKN
jgi:pullulanase